MTKTVLGNGLVGASGYDAAGQLKAINYTAGTTALAGYTANYDGAGQVSALGTTGTVAAPTVSYSYDQVNRLTKVNGVGTYGYDKADNPTKVAGGVTQSFNAANELVSSTKAGGTSYKYDSRGNRLSATSVSGGATTMAYDQANRLKSASSTGYSATYKYNGDGTRMAKTVSGVTDNFTWDASTGLPMLLKDNTNYYIYDPHGLPLAQIRVSDGQTLWFGHDTLGNTRILTDANQAKVAQFSYDAYGNVTASSGTTTTALKYRGEYHDAETGYIYLRARYYDPSTAQFLTRDPLVHISRSAYGYAAQSPLNYTDPSGLIAFVPVLLAAWAVADTALAVADIYFTYQIWTDECSTSTDKAISGGLTVVGVLAPVGGGALAYKAFRAGKATEISTDAVVFRSDTSHIFRRKEGHFLSDTPANRTLIRSAIRPENVVFDKQVAPGQRIQRYAKVLPDGLEVWAEVRNGNEITNGGMNVTPRNR